QRYIKSGDYQDFVKTRIKSFGIKPKGGHLVTQLDLSALSFAECSYRYLCAGGTIAFVMPRGVLRGRQYEEFTKFQFGGFTYMAGIEFWDLKNVKELFNVPASVLICQREGPGPKTVPLLRFTAKLPRKNASWAEALAVVKTEADTWVRDKALIKPSPYRGVFRQGATLVPQCFWFVRFDTSPWGFNPSAPPVSSYLKSDAKKPWHDIELKGQIESDYIWACALPGDILPFISLRMKPVVLPLVVAASGKVQLIDSAEASARGSGHLSDWLKEAESYWSARRTEKSPKQLAERLDYSKELSAQFPAKGRYMVLFTKSATYLTACLIDREILPEYPIGEQSLRPRGLVVDDTTYWYATDDDNEAFYLVAWLNSPSVDAAIKVDQTMGLYGPRDIHKRPLEFPLPSFESKDSHHRELAEAGRRAYEAATEELPALPDYTSIASLRSSMRSRPKVAKELKLI